MPSYVYRVALFLMNNHGVHHMHQTMTFTDAIGAHSNSINFVSNSDSAYLIPDTSQDVFYNGRLY